MPASCSRTTTTFAIRKIRPKIISQFVTDGTFRCSILAIITTFKRSE